MSTKYKLNLEYEKGDNVLNEGNILTENESI